MRWSRLLFAALAWAVLTCEVALAQSRKTHAQSILPMDYIWGRLKRLEGKGIANDLLGEQFFGGVGTEINGLVMEKIERLSNCSLSVTFQRVLAEFDRTSSSDPIAVGGLCTLHATVDLKNAELGGVSAKGKRVVLRMVAPVRARELTKMKFGEKPFEDQESVKEMRFLAFPAEDEEDARRMARAFNEQIRLCGGNVDPFAR